MTSLLCNVLKNDCDPNLTIIFNYVFDSGERLFKFQRSKNELLADMAARMKINFDKALSKNKNFLKNNSDGLKIDFYFNSNFADLQMKNEQFWIEGSEMHINNTVYFIGINFPTVLDIKFSNVILTKYLIYPHVHLCNANISQSNFIWYRRNKNNKEYEWENVYTGYAYEVKEDDVNFELKVVCQPSNGNKFGISSEAISVKPIKHGPQSCSLEYRQSFTKTKLLHTSNQFRVVSYNLLADFYANSIYSQTSLFPYCKLSYLSFDYRKLLILKELINYNGDIYFLQEVDKIFYENGLEPILNNLGYDSSFLCKIQSVEGLASFYSRSKFSLINSETHVFSNLLSNCDLFIDLYEKINQNVNLLKRICKLKNNFQVMVLKHKLDEKQILITSNLHLYSKEDADHIRLLQTYICLNYVQSLLSKYKQDANYADYKISVIISGDFNSTPEFGVVKLVNNKIAHSSLEDFRSNENEIIENCTLQHDLNLKSACGFPEYTNYTKDFVGCLDYIFYDHMNLNVVDVVPFPNHEDVIKQTALPNENFPSDHIPLVCTFEWS